MANILLEYGPYNSKSGSERVYDARAIGRMFDGVITDGVFPYIGDAFNISKKEQLLITVGTGRAWFNHTWNYLESPMTFKLDNGDASYNRIDAVILQINASELVRENKLLVRKGTPATSPKPPVVKNDDDEQIYEYVLGYIVVPRNASVIQQNNIHYIVGLDADPYYKKSEIAGYAYAVGDNHIGEKIITIDKNDSAWIEHTDEDGAKYYTRVIPNITGIANNHILSADVYISDNNVNKAQMQISTFGAIYRYTLVNNVLTLYSFFKPEIEFSIRFIGKGANNVQ